MQKILIQSPSNIAPSKHKAEGSKKRLTKLNFYLAQIGKSLGTENFSLYK